MGELLRKLDKKISRRFCFENNLPVKRLTLSHYFFVNYLAYRKANFMLLLTKQPGLPIMLITLLETRFNPNSLLSTSVLRFEPEIYEFWE